VIKGLQVFFFLILLAMLAVTTIASLDRSVFEAGADLWPDPWFRATLADAYFGFLVIYLWIAYKERTWSKRALWFVLLMTLGNIAIAVYFLIQLARLPGSAAAKDLLLRREDRT
jgi:cell division protein FtsW (lipid II flippase)